VYNKILHNYKFVQAHWVELLTRVRTKFTLNFLDLPMSFSRISNFESHFLELFTKREMEKGLNDTWAESGHGLGPSSMAAYGAGARRPTSTARPTRETGPRGARSRARRAQRHGHRAVATRVTALWRGRRHRSRGPSTVRSSGEASR
jgi:hypothetical protein